MKNLKNLSMKFCEFPPRLTVLDLSSIYYFWAGFYTCFNNKRYDYIVSRIVVTYIRERSFLCKSKGKDHIPSTSQKAGLTGFYKTLLFMSTTAISKPFFQEVDSAVILPLTFVKGWVFPAYIINKDTCSAFETGSSTIHFQHND